MSKNSQIIRTKLYVQQMRINHDDLLANNSSSRSAFSDPAVANMIVVSRSPRMPATVLAAFSRAWVPRAIAFSDESTLAHFSPTLRALSDTSRSTKVSLGLSWTEPAALTSWMVTWPRCWTDSLIRSAISRLSVD